MINPTDKDIGRAVIWFHYDQSSIVGAKLASCLGQRHPEKPFDIPFDNVWLDFGPSAPGREQFGLLHSTVRNLEWAD